MSGEKKIASISEKTSNEETITETGWEGSVQVEPRNHTKVQVGKDPWGLSSPASLARETYPRGTKQNAQKTKMKDEDKEH